MHDFPSRVAGPTKGHPFVRFRSSPREASGEARHGDGVLDRHLQDVEIFLAVELLSARRGPRDVSGASDVAPIDEPSDFGLVYLWVRQVDAAKVINLDHVRRIHLRKG
jgi:hypothetical protein